MEKNPKNNVLYGIPYIDIYGIPYMEYQEYVDKNVNKIREISWKPRSEYNKEK